MKHATVFPDDVQSTWAHFQMTLAVAKPIVYSCLSVPLGVLVPVSPPLNG